MKITVFYPADGVSRMQKLQMTTTLGGNVYVAAVDGNFDDAQNGVKAIFGDASLAEKANENGFFFSSANSINWGRLAPQIVYYVSAYIDLVNGGKIAQGDPVNVCVPTGNFGNIFAAYIAREMGIPLAKLICASNSNNVLTDFINTGVYDRTREFRKTISPSMDILISSNLERLLSVCGGAELTGQLMAELKSAGKYTAPESLMAAIREQADADDLLDEIVDRYGEPPRGVLNLIDIALLRANARKVHIQDIKQKAGDVLFTMTELNLEAISKLGAEPDYKSRVQFIASAKQPTLRLRLSGGVDSLKQSKVFIQHLQQYF